MNEELLYFIWKFALFSDFSLHDAQTTEIQIIQSGIRNTDSGPDFFDSRIKTGDAVWAGNIEIHLKSSDWYRHGHHHDKAYNNVILQVVFEHDKQVFCENGRLIPVLQIEIDQKMLDKYRQLNAKKDFVACMPDFESVELLKKQLWFDKVLIERLESKSEFIEKILVYNKSSWEDTFYQLLARSFGFGVNSDPFEWLAKSVPQRILAKHHDNLIQIEALLFGQAGFLEESGITADYYIQLKNEYTFLKSKYQLIPIDKHLWKFLRTRPSNFPTIRISQFANLIYHSQALFSKILKAKSPQQIMDFFDLEASPFWQNHFLFDKETAIKSKRLGKSSIEIILINTVIPLLFVYGSKTGDDAIKERAFAFLDQLKPEKNAILNKWKKLRMEISSAFHSQALLQQFKAYCQKGRCLECGIGIEILKHPIGK